MYSVFHKAMRQIPGEPLCFLMLFFLMSSCAIPGKMLETPKISLVNIELRKTSIFETLFQVDLRIFNNNEVPFTVKGLDCRFSVNGKDLAQGLSEANILIPAYGTAIFPVSLYSSAADMLRSLLRVKDRNTLRYEISGHLRLEGGFLIPSRIPFSSAGEISLETLLERR